MRNIGSHIKKWMLHSNWLCLAVKAALLYPVYHHVTWYWFCIMQTAFDTSTDPPSSIGCHIKTWTLLNDIFITMYLIHVHHTFNTALLHPVYCHVTWYWLCAMQTTSWESRGACFNSRYNKNSKALLHIMNQFTYTSWLIYGHTINKINKQKECGHTINKGKKWGYTISKGRK